MKASRSFRHLLAVLPPIAMLLTPPAIPPGAAQETTFLEISISPEEIYRYSNLKFTGDYTSFESAAGSLALGRTAAGVTLVIVLGGDTVTFDAPETVKEKFIQVFSTQPLKTTFKTVYMRLNPKEYEEVFGKQDITKAPNDQALEQAKLIFADRFLTSYHAGDKAILPPYKTRVMDFDTADFGMIAAEEGYWLRLNRMSPFGRIYPKDFVNPKQK